MHCAYISMRERDKGKTKKACGREHATTLSLLQHSNEAEVETEQHLVLFDLGSNNLSSSVT